MFGGWCQLQKMFTFIFIGARLSHLNFEFVFLVVTQAPPVNNYWFFFQTKTTVLHEKTNVCFLAVLDGLMDRLAGKQGHWTLQQVAKVSNLGFYV